MPPDLPATPTTPAAAPTAPAPAAPAPVAQAPVAPAPGTPPATPKPTGDFVVPAWLEGADPEDLAMAEAKAWQSPLDAVRAARSAQKLLGVPVDQLLRFPGEGAGREALLPIYQKLGMPEKPEGYDFGEHLKPVEGGLDLQTPFRAVAHELGLGKAQAARLAEWYEGVAQQQIAQMTEQTEVARTAAVNTLRGEWGQAYEAKLENARAFARTLGLDPEVEVLLEQALGPEKMARTFADLGEKLGEYKVIEAPSVPGGGMSPSLAAEKARALMADPAFMDAANPRHAEVVAQYLKMNEAIHGTAPALEGGYAAT